MTRPRNSNGYRGTDEEYVDHATEARKLTKNGMELEEKARKSLSKADLEAAKWALKEASAMHTRAALSAQAGGIESAGHIAHSHVINDLVKALHKVYPKVK